MTHAGGLMDLDPKKQNWVIWTGFLGANVFYLVVMSLIGRSPAPAGSAFGKFVPVLGGLALGSLALAAILRRHFRRRAAAAPGQAVGLQRISFVLTMALAEAVVIYGLMIFFTLRSWPLTAAFFLAGVGTQLYFRPTLFAAADSSIESPAEDSSIEPR